MVDRAPVLVVTGLAAEARIAAGAGCRVIAGGGDRPGLSRRLAAEDDDVPAVVISFGIAGGLEPGLPVGAVVLATEVRQVPQAHATAHLPDAAGLHRPADRPDRASGFVSSVAAQLANRGFVVREGAIAGVDRPAATIDEKRALYEVTGALVVDMESHVAADYAAGRGVPFLAIRIVSDGAGDAIPSAAARAMRPDGSVDVSGLLLALAREPGQIPGLIATARNAAVAFRRLRGVRGLLGQRFGLHL